MPFKMLNAWTRLIIFSSDKWQWQVFLARQQFSNQLFEQEMRKKKQHKWFDQIDDRVYVCDLLTLNRFQFNQKMFANLKNANNLGFRCLAINWKWMQRRILSDHLRLNRNEGKCARHQMNAAKNQTFLVIDCKHIIDIAINNI